MKKIVVLSGAGISVESGLKTFRGAGGLWEGHDITKVASPEGWHKDPELVLNFYNERRKQLKSVKPNSAHIALVELEEKYDVTVITQNVDDLHERAGSSKVLHLHGELKKVRSTGDPSLIYDTEDNVGIGNCCEKGFQLRPHIVWFGEMVPEMENAAEVARIADIFIVVGTSLVVYPAAGLIHYTRLDIPKYLVDPNEVEFSGIPGLKIIAQYAGTGLPALVKELMI